MHLLQNLFKPKENENSSKLALEGEVLRRQGNYKKALSKFNRAIELESDNDMFYASRSAVKQALKDYNGAKNDIEKAMQLNPNVNAYKNAQYELSKHK